MPQETSKDHKNNQSHSHSHGHGHHHHHHHQSIKNLGIAFLLNASFCVIEFIGGFYTNSAAIMSDALHDLGDSLALGFAWWAENKSVQPSDVKFSYGYRRFSILAALVTGVVLVVGSFVMMAIGVGKLITPEPVSHEGMFWFALLGLAFNGVGALRLNKDNGLNSRMMKLHLLEDTLGWLAVLMVSIVLYFYNEPRIDAIAAIMIAIWVLKNAIENLKHTLSVFLQGTPLQTTIAEVESMLKSQEGVMEVHHSHFWSMDGEHHIYTTHIVVKESLDWFKITSLKAQLKKELFEQFHITEATLEIERQGDHCADPNHQESHS